MNFRILFAVFCLLLVCVIADASIMETWDSGPGDWMHYIPGQGEDGDVGIDWAASGGVTGGFVFSDLGNLGIWEVTDHAYYPLYAYNSFLGVPSVPVDLGVSPWISVSVKDGTTGGSVDLGNGALRFWIGEWSDPDGEGGPEPEQYSFFYWDGPDGVVSVGGEDWSEHTMRVSGSGPWVTLADNQGKTAADLLADPQQWGFGVFGDTEQPTGVLCFDNLAAQMVPEPTSSFLMLVGFVGLGFWGRRRRG